MRGGGGEGAITWLREGVEWVGRFVVGGYDGAVIYFFGGLKSCYSCIVLKFSSSEMCKH